MQKGTLLKQKIHTLILLNCYNLIMLTPEQEKRLSRFCDTNEIKIYPFDPNCLIRFETILTKIKSILGENAVVELKGSSGLKISGKGELDIYIPVDVNDFDVTVSKIKTLFGDPGSLYPLDRARFATQDKSYEDEIFVVNNQGKSWLTGLKFEGYLKDHPDELERYKKLKEDSAGLSTQAYYRIKEEYINEILSKAN